jgi:hypothetical protein
VPGAAAHQGTHDTLVFNERFRVVKVLGAADTTPEAL